MHVEIMLSRGMVTLVDEADYPLVAGCKWHVIKGKNTWYAARAGGAGKPQILMHRQIVEARIGLEVDHRDGDGLNNRRINLRVCTHAENIRNSPKQAGTVSRFKGVHRNHGKWVAAIETMGVKTYLGAFDSEIDAARQYDRAARLTFGRFARTNEMMGLLGPGSSSIASRSASAA